MNRNIVTLLVPMGLFLTFCSYEKEYKEYKINDLTTPLTDTLEFKKEGRIIGVEVIIIGNIKGNASIQFENGAGRFNEIDLRDKVNRTYETEWYSSKYVFKYIPNSDVTGDSLIIKYRMY